MKGALIGIGCWLAFSALSILCFSVIFPTYLLTAWFDPTRRYTGKVTRISGRVLMKAFPMWSFHVESPLPRALPERCVCVSNHCSNIDPFLLSHLPWEMKFLAKAVLFRIPCVGWAMKLAGDIRLVRGSSASVRSAMEGAARYVKVGMPVLIFPEGTRSTTRELLSFKDGAFRLAIEQKAAVVPIAIVGTSHALQKGGWKPGAARGACLVGEAIPTDGLTLDDARQLRETTRERIVALRQLLVERGYKL